MQMNATTSHLNKHMLSSIPSFKGENKKNIQASPNKVVQVVEAIKTIKKDPNIPTQV